MFPKPFCARHLWTWAGGIWHDWNAAPANLESAHHRMWESNVSPKRWKTLKNYTSMKGQHWLQRPSIILHFESLCIILTRIYCHQQERNHERQRRKHTIYHNSASSKNAKQRDVCLAIRMAGPTPPKTNIDSSNKNTLRNTWQTEEAKQRKRMKDKLCKFMKLCKKPSCSLYSLHKTTRYSGEKWTFQQRSQSHFVYGPQLWQLHSPATTDSTGFGSSVTSGVLRPWFHNGSHHPITISSQKLGISANRLRHKRI